MCSTALLGAAGADRPRSHAQATRDCHERKIGWLRYPLFIYLFICTATGLKAARRSSWSLSPLPYLWFMFLHFDNRYLIDSLLFFLPVHLFPRLQLRRQRVLECTLCLKLLFTSLLLLLLLLLPLLLLLLLTFSFASPVLLHDIAPPYTQSRVSTTHHFFGIFEFSSLKKQTNKKRVPVLPRTEKTRWWRRRWKGLALVGCSARWWGVQKQRRTRFVFHSLPAMVSFLYSL